MTAKRKYKMKQILQKKKKKTKSHLRVMKMRRVHESIPRLY
jgi:hypothetical protein